MKQKTVFVCRECGYETAKWIGKCPGCGAWNSMEEEVQQPKAAKAAVTGAAPVLLNAVPADDKARCSTGISEVDVVLGGGLVRGSMVLVGGEPGIGKSTLLLQLCTSLSKEGLVLYVSGEESGGQIKLRADRLDIAGDKVMLLAETNVNAVCAQIEALSPAVVIIDSIQTMYDDTLTSASGSVSQVREATMRFMQIANQRGISFLIVGHVTKEGAIAGPRVLEHMVDCVLYFEGDRHQSYRILRAVKNRFGSTNEIGVFEMEEKGLLEVKNPSASLLSQRQEEGSGECIVCMVEGTRPLLAEVQALVTPTGFGIPRRAVTGADYNRMVLLLAVIEKRMGLSLQNQDVYVNITGGIKIDDPSADLALVAAVASGLKDKIISREIALFGEVGLAGEVRSVTGAEKRVAELARLGFRKCLLPQSCLAKINAPGIELVGVQNVTQLPALLGL